MKCLLAFLFLIHVSSANARPIDLNVSDYGWLTSFPPLRDTLDFYVQGIEDDINEEQPILDPSRINYGTANSSVLASKGLGTDYVNDPQELYVSLGLGVAWDDEKDAAIRHEISGAAAASSLTVGTRMNKLTTNAKFLGLDSSKLMGFINFGTFTYSGIIPSGDIDIAGDTRATNLGVHLRYDWGRVKFHAGYEYNNNKVDLSSNIDKPLELNLGAPGVLSGRFQGKPTYSIDSQTHSFPFEISSNVSFLKVLNLYGGFGMDLNFGVSKGKGDVKGDITALACSSGICVGETVLPQLEAEANYDAQSQVRNLTFRGFAGMQIDLPWRLHAFAQVSQMIGTKVKGVSGGLKYSF